MPGLPSPGSERIIIQHAPEAPASLEAILQLQRSLHREQLAYDVPLRQHLEDCEADVAWACQALSTTLARHVQCLDIETGDHLQRIRRSSRLLALTAAECPLFAPEIDARFVDLLDWAAPLHDIGKIGLPSAILLKPDQLTPEERQTMQTHTVLGSEMLQAVARQISFAQERLQWAGTIARSHHERFDGSGYPDGLVGRTIPLTARIVAIADVYDALRSARVYKPALSHKDTVQVMTEDLAGQFDPDLLALFCRQSRAFERLWMS